jgi:hypothetical protein
MAETAVPLPTIIPGRLPIGFCPGSEQERLEAFARAMTVSSSSGKPGKDAIDGERGPPGPKPVIAISYEVENVEITVGEKVCAWDAPDGVDPWSVRVEPVDLYGPAITSVVRAGQTITVTLSANVTGTIPGSSPVVDVINSINFIYPVFTITYEEQT